MTVMKGVRQFRMYPVPKHFVSDFEFVIGTG
jgi:hypothetical protein